VDHSEDGGTRFEFKFAVRHVTGVRWLGCIHTNTQPHVQVVLEAAAQRGRKFDGQALDGTRRTRCRC
jgi:hypothetical protein